MRSAKKHYKLRTPKKGFIKKLPSIIGIVVCILLTPVLIMNLTIIIKSYINPDEVPDFFGIKPLIVLSGSMEPKISEGDLVISKTVDPSSLKVGDIISFKEGNSIITHRIIEITEKNGEPAFITKGDANDVRDSYLITYPQIEGVHIFSIGSIGYLAMFMQTPLGMLVFVGIPLCGFVLYDIWRNRAANKKEKTSSIDSDALEEINKLKAELELAQKNNSGTSDGFAS